MKQKLKFNSDTFVIMQVKKITGGEKFNSRLVHGEVCTLKLAHRNMSNELKDPMYVYYFLPFAGSGG
jgi:hypothetical protein